MSIEDLIRLGELAFLAGSGWQYLKFRLGKVEGGLKEVRSDIKRLRRTVYSLRRHLPPTPNCQ